MYVMEVFLNHQEPTPVMDREQRLIAGILAELREPSHSGRLGELAIASGQPQGITTLFDIDTKFHHGGYGSLATFVADVRKAVLQQYRLYGLDSPQATAAEYLEDRLATKIALCPTEIKAQLSLDHTRRVWQREQGMEPSLDLGRRRSSRKSKFTLKQQVVPELGRCWCVAHVSGVASTCKRLLIGLA